MATTNGQLLEYSNEKETFPISSAGTGTISTGNTSNHIVGSSTNFLAEVKASQKPVYLWDKTNDELRRVVEVSDDENLWLESAFSNTLSAVSFGVVSQPHSLISFLVKSSGDEKVNGISFADGSGATSGESGGGATQLPEPIVVDATQNGGKVIVEFQ